MNCPLFCPFNQDSFVAGFVALQLAGSGAFVAHEALLALKHENGSVDQVEIVLSVLLGSIAVGKEMARLLGANEFSVIALERNGTILVPVQLKESTWGSAAERQQ